MKGYTIHVPEEILADWKERIKPATKRKILRKFEHVRLELDGLATELICDFFPPSCALMRELTKAKVILLSLERLLDESIPLRDIFEIYKEAENEVSRKFRYFNRFSYDESTGKKSLKRELRKKLEVSNED